MKIALIGFMGAGKSTVAKAISRYSGIPTIECDEEIIKESNLRSIPEIFSKRGEKYFRELESKVLQKALNNSSDCVVSSGGGIIESLSNQEALIKSGAVIVALDVPFEVAIQRAGDTSGRPLLQDITAAKLRYEKRQSEYLKIADLIIPTQYYKPETIAQAILSRIKGENNLSSYMKIFSVIGDPVGHSISPSNYGEEFLKQGLSQTNIFLAEHVRKEKIEDFINKFRRSKVMQGLAVTIPLKEVIIPFLDHLSKEASAIGAVNTVVKDKEGKLLGFNTDYLGILNPLSTKTAIANKKVAILGAGGTARAAAYAVKSQGANVTIINRSESTGLKLLNDLTLDHFKLLSEVKDLKVYDIIINTTPVGLAISASEQTQELPLFLSAAFSKNSIVMDVVYKPEITPFLEEAKKAGADIITGKQMFVAQWVEQYRIMVG